MNGMCNVIRSGVFLHEFYHLLGRSLSCVICLVCDDLNV